MRVGVFVGSFNPVHNGHIETIKYLVDKDYVDKVLVIPTLAYWDKNNLAPLEDRINMLKFYETYKIVVDTEHNGLPYTYMIINALKKEHPNDSFHLIIGADNVVDFHKWREYQDILSNKVIVLNREGVDISEYVNKYPNKDDFIVASGSPYINVSSTEIREGLSEAYMHPQVIQYIKDHNLYRKKSM